MGNRIKLFTWKDPYDTAGTEALFVSAMRDNCAFHYAHCPEYRAILDHFGFRPDMLRTTADLARLPVLPTLYFKSHKLFSLPESRMLIKATSSGTRGKKSVIGFELGGLWSGFHMVWRILRYHRFLSPVPTNYLILGYQPHKSNQTAVAKTATGYTYITPAIHREYALKYKDGGYQVDFDGLIRTLERYSRSRFPTRFMGFPAYTYFLMEELERRGLRYPLPKNSKIFLGGGWKQFYTQQVDKPVLYDLVKRVLGLDNRDIIEVFSAVEHPILYADCVAHHFHIPIYSRAIIRDVNTLEPLPPGQVGLVELITPLMTATPILAVMTDDLGVVHPGGSCSCGNPSPWLEIIGRVGLKDIKTCAAGAAELLSGGGET